MGNDRNISPPIHPKYLGLRLTILADMTSEREYVIKKAATLGAMLKGLPYHPRQMHLVVQTAIVPNFRYSAALAKWNSSDLNRLWKVWCRSLKNAWKLKPATAAGFFYTAEHGGLDVASPGEILTKETACLMEQCFAIPSDLSDMLKMEMCQLVCDMGCSTIEELHAT